MNIVLKKKNLGPVKACLFYWGYFKESESLLGFCRLDID